MEGLESSHPRRVASKRRLLPPPVLGAAAVRVLKVGTQAQGAAQESPLGVAQESPLGAAMHIEADVQAESHNLHYTDEVPAADQAKIKT